MPAIVDGDRRFEAVDERRDPGQLEAGILSEAINADLSRSEIENRRGFYATPGHRGKGISFPVSFSASFSENIGHGQIYGATPYTSAAGESYFVLALERYAVRIHISGAVELIQYPLKSKNCLVDALDEDVELVQAYDKLYMFRGKSKDPWVWDGKQTVASDIAEFTPVQRTNLEAGVEPMPQSKSAIYYLNRLWVLKGKDEVVYSDIGVETDFNLTNAFKIDSGSFDAVVGMKAWGDNAIVVFKEKSVDLLENLQGDLTVNGTRTRLSGEIGLASPSCITDVGRDLWFLSERGVFSISQALDNKLQSNAEPLSAPLEPVFRRINWNVKGQFRSAFWENSYYLSVALDDSLTNNAVIVYSFITQSWHGYHQSNFLDAERMFVNFQNKEKYLYAISNLGVINRLYVGIEDESVLLSDSRIVDYKGSYNASTNTPDLDSSPPAFDMYKGDTYYVTVAGSFFGEAVVNGDVLILKKNIRKPDPSTGFAGDTTTAADWYILKSTDIIKQIALEATTRGYGSAEVERKQFRKTDIDISEWNPSYSISVETDGVNETDTLEPNPVTRNRTKYHTVGTPAYDATNTNDDHGNAYREDYSVDYGATGSGTAGSVVESFEYSATGGADLDMMQRIEFPKVLNVRGEYMTVKISTTQGRVKVHSIKSQGFTYNRPATIQA